MTTTPVPPITYAEAHRRITEAARGREDYVNAVPLSPEHPDYDHGDSDLDQYASCVYVTTSPDGEQVPSCIVGHAWFAEIRTAGIDADSELNFQGGTTVVPNVTHRPLTEKAARFLMTVQIEQDSGATWGAAINRAVKVADGAPDNRVYSGF